ncbi:hypothetical protein V5O48_008217 [Marasmius crinis-equi]|uniref:DUF6589 domain-containing protein n=1 Tax=Marasmius crinis-equi TaxID=585013 RepID=A0ABR3FEL2_9AGAR
MSPTNPATPPQNTRNPLADITLSGQTAPSSWTAPSSSTRSRYEEIRASKRGVGRPSKYAELPHITTATPSRIPSYNSPPLLQPSFTLPSPVTPSVLQYSYQSISNSQAQLPLMNEAPAMHTSTLPGPRGYQPRIEKKPVMSMKERMGRVMELLFDDLGFETLGDFLSALFPAIPRGESNLHDRRHVNKLKAFLQGRSTFRAVNLVESIVSHRYSLPSYKSEHYHERGLAFSNTLPSEIHHANSAITSWATQIVGEQVYAEIGRLTLDDGESPFRIRLAAAAKERSKAKGVMTISRGDILSFNVADRVKEFKRRAPVTWHLTECMAGPREKGVIVVRKQRPHPIVQFSAISSFISAQNKFATGHFALHAGIWHLACQSQTDVKRIACRTGASVHDTSARAALKTLADDALSALRDEVEAAAQLGEVSRRYVFDNTQRHSAVHEGGMARESRLISGTSCTAIKLEDCAPNAFNVEDHHSRILKNERASLNTCELFESIDWEHISGVQALHALRALCSFVIPLNPMLKVISDRFRSPDGYAKHRMRDGRKTVVQPLGTNSEKEIETAGLVRCLDDFQKQAGFKPEYASKVLAWFSGDGGSYLSVDRGKKYRALMRKKSDPSGDQDYHTLRHILPTVELWHTQTTLQNTIGANHYGPPSSSDPSSLSRSSNAAKFKRPANFKDASNFYPLSRSMGAIWDAQIIDCWRIMLGLDSHDDIIRHFERLEKEKKLPSFDELFQMAQTLIARYASLEAYEQALSSEANQLAAEKSTLKIWLFIFAGSSNTNYRDMLLEMWCLFKYESSKELKDAIWNNWLVNLTGELGKWIPGDLMQEHYNRWLEEHVGKSGLSFDDPFIRNTISPNVDFFIVLKKEFELAFDLHKRSQSHTSPHLRDEFRAMLKLYAEEYLHYFIQGRSLGHAAVNLLSLGFDRFDDGVLNELLNKHTARVEALKHIDDIRTRARDVSMPTDTTIPSTASNDLPFPSDSTLSSPTLSQTSSAAGFDDDSQHETDSDSKSSKNDSDPSESDSYPSESDNDHRESENEMNKSVAELEEEELAATEEEHSRLEPGPETMPMIDQETGILVNDWMTEEELQEEMLKEESEGSEEERALDSGTDKEPDSDSDSCEDD